MLCTVKSGMENMRLQYCDEFINLGRDLFTCSFVFVQSGALCGLQNRNEKGLPVDNNFFEVNISNSPFRHLERVSEREIERKKERERESSLASSA
jgi:hypothetical protein